jgi:hypothetical protein
MLHCVHPVKTDVSKENIASILRIERIQARSSEQLDSTMKH